MARRRYDLRAWQLADLDAKRKAATDPSAAATAETNAAIRPLTPRQVAGRLAALRCDPLAIMAKLAKNTSLDPSLRVALARHLAAYQIEQAPAVAGEKALPALGDVIAAAWRKPKASIAADAAAAKAAAAARAKRRTGK